MKRLISLMFIGIFLISGCQYATTGSDQVKMAGMSETGDGDLLFGSTQSLTPFLPIVDIDNQIATSINGNAGGDSINITQIESLEEGKAMLYWDAAGEFPEGFMVVWTKEKKIPVFPEDKGIQAGDGTARSALVTGSTGDLYYYRVCKFQNGACISYSAVASYTFGKISQSTLVKSSTPEPGLAITIKSIQSAGNGKATISWDASGSFPSGFKVVWSETTSEPVYPGNANVALSSASVRSAVIDGTPGKKVNFRVCRFNGNKCDYYSNSYAFTFTGTAVTTSIAPTASKAPTATSSGRSITIISIGDRKIGTSTVVWIINGSFTSGFIVVWSDSTNTPVYPGNDNKYANLEERELAQSAVAYGIPGKTYTFRVCEYIGDNICGIYSNSYRFTYNGATATPKATETDYFIRINSVDFVSSGKAVINWYASDDSAKGFKIVWSDNSSQPYYPNNESITASSSERSAIVYGTPGVRYYYRICSYFNGVCYKYGGPVEFTYPSDVPTSTSVNTAVIPTEILLPTLPSEVPPTVPPVPSETPVPPEIPVETAEGSGG